MMNAILVATDFSPDADTALAVAIEMATRFANAIELTHVHQSGSYILPPPFDLISLPPEGREYAHIEKALEERVGRIRSAGVAATAQAVTGTAPDAIVARAKEIDAVLIVVGSRGAGALAHILLGSVAERVVRHAPCPVLVVPHVKPAAPATT
jgi:nucleotide-binding universal stress UspA family protein